MKSSQAPLFMYWSMAGGLGSSSPAVMNLMLTAVPASKMSGPVPVGRAAASFCSASRKVVLSTSRLKPGLLPA